MIEIKKNINYSQLLYQQGYSSHLRGHSKSMALEYMPIANDMLFEWPLINQHILNTNSRSIITHTYIKTI